MGRRRKENGQIDLTQERPASPVIIRGMSQESSKMLGEIHRRRRYRSKLNFFTRLLRRVQFMGTDSN